MFFLRTSDFDPPLILVTAPVSFGVTVCPAPLWPPSIPAEVWSAIYRLAYEQFVTAFAPTALQRMAEPSLN